MSELGELRDGNGDFICLVKIVDPRDRVVEEARAFVRWARAATVHGQRYSISANDVLPLGEAVDACEDNWPFPEPAEKRPMSEVREQAPATVWLIERVDSDAPTYVRSISPDDVSSTTNPLEALQFPDAGAARDALAYMSSRGFSSAIWGPREHEFVSGSEVSAGLVP